MGRCARDWAPKNVSGRGASRWQPGLCIPLCALVLIAFPLHHRDASAQDASPEGVSKDQAEVKERYEKAFQLFKSGGYSQAIQEWNEVLKLDPGQTSASQMLLLARQKIDERDRARQEVLFGHVRNGAYAKALVALQPLLESDPTHPLYKTLRGRLEKLSIIVPFVPTRTKPWNAAVTGLTGYISRKENLRLTYNGLTYAQELDPREERFERLMELLLGEAPDLARLRPAPGARILESLRATALTDIYDGKYHQAVDLLDQVLSLDPNDLAALKRVGSAHYALRQYGEAEKAWLRALQIAPGDETLRNFLTKIDKRRSRKRPPSERPASE